MFFFILKTRFISKYNIFSSFKYDHNCHLCCCCCHLFSDSNQCSNMVHIFDAVSTNRLVILSTQHATASSIVLYYYYNYYISCICIYYVYRPGRSKSTTSFQILYPQPTTLTSETKTTTSSYATPIHPRRHLSQSSVPFLMNHQQCQIL